MILFWAIPWKCFPQAETELTLEYDLSPISTTAPIWASEFVGEERQKRHTAVATIAALHVDSTKVDKFSRLKWEGHKNIGQPSIIYMANALRKPVKSKRPHRQPLILY